MAKKQVEETAVEKKPAHEKKADEHKDKGPKTAHRKLRKPSKKQQEKGFNSKAKKKEASARALIKAGKGIIKINNRNIITFEPRYVRMLIEEPLMIAGDLRNEIDINVDVHGSGFMSQAIAARGAIAKAIIEFTGDEKLRDTYLEYDRMLLVDDVRRKEAKKPLGKGARSKKQKSKR